MIMAVIVLNLVFIIQVTRPPTESMICHIYPINIEIEIEIQIEIEIEIEIEIDKNMIAKHNV